MTNQQLDPEIIQVRNDPDLTREQKIDAIATILARKGSKVPEHLVPADWTGEVELASWRIGPDGAKKLVPLEPEASRALIARTFLEDDC